MPGREPSSRWLGGTRGLTREGRAHPEEPSPRALSVSCFSFSGEKGISEQIFVMKRNLGWVQKSQIIRRDDLSLMMLPGHSQSVSKCFLVSAREGSALTSEASLCRCPDTSSGAWQRPPRLPRNHFRGPQPCPARGKVTCWRGESTGLRQDRPGVNPSL